VDGRQLRWYRVSFVWYAVATALGSILSFVGGIWDVVGLGLGAVFALLSLQFLAISFRAGIGVGPDGVLVRRALGQNRWVPWAQVQRFDLKEKATRYGMNYQIAVIRTDATQLSTGVWSIDSSTKRSINRNFHQLDNEQRKANHRLGLPT
jgi:hypothetical protein